MTLYNSVYMTILHIACLNADHKINPFWGPNLISWPFPWLHFNSFAFFKLDRMTCTYYPKLIAWESQFVLPWSCLSMPYTFLSGRWDQIENQRQLLSWLTPSTSCSNTCSILGSTSCSTFCSASYSTFWCPYCSISRPTSRFPFCFSS